ncbi:MAG: hypothetical protein ACP5UB_08410 [Candidatus Sumerlaeaceae bacterium]
METFLLLLAYAGRAIVILTGAFGVGWLCTRSSASLLPRSIAVVQTIAHGFGMLGLVALLLGLTRALSPTVLQVVLFMATAAFVAVAWRARLSFRFASLPLGFSMRQLSSHHWLIITVSALCLANVTIGALAPDASQDSLWYHLSCARAWLHWHAPYAWPTVYPSGYNLHGSLLYAYALSIGDEIDCSILYAVFGLLTFTGVAAYARDWFGWRAALWGWFLCATAYATYVWFVPINTGSDLMAAMFATLGVLAALDTLRYDDDHPRHRAQRNAAAWLLGWGVVTKLTVLGYVLLPVAAVLVVNTLGMPMRSVPAEHRSGAKVWQGAIDFLLFLCIAAIPLLVWSVRSIFYGAGNPFFPLFRDLLPLKPEFALTRRNLAINTMYPLSLQGFAEVCRNIPNKLTYAMVARSPGVLFHASLGLGLIVSRHKLWRAIGVIAVLQWVVFFWSRGFCETIKYFSVCFPAAFVFVAARVAHFEESSLATPALKRFALLAGIMLLSYIYAARQIEWGHYKTINWPYRPILRHKERLVYLSTKPYQLENIWLYDAANQLLPSHATVLFPDSAYPFYLNRKYIWVDDDLDFFRHLTNLGVSDGQDVRLFLSDRGVTHVIVSPRKLAQWPAWSTVLEPVNLSTPQTTARLYRVKQ